MKNHRFNIVSVILGILLISVGYGCSYSTKASADKEDADGDGYCLGAVDCETSSLMSGDCNDNNHFINPSVVEVAGDSVDNDCDGNVDEEEANKTEDADDDDGDSFTEIEGDCDDANSSIYPGAEEIADNGIDEDCDGEDAKIIVIVDPAPPASVDADGDGYIFDVDCDDSNPSVNVKTVFYSDTDADGFGDPNHTIELCELFSGYSADNTDCDDANTMVHPGGNDVAGDGVDGDCNGVDATPAVVDADGDGYNSTVDCNDSNALINPGVEENYFSGNGGFGHGDGINNDCDAQTDETWCDCYDLPGFSHPDYTVEQSPTNWAQRAVCDNYLQVFQNSYHWDCVQNSAPTPPPSGDCDDPGSFPTPDLWEANCGDDDPAPSPANPLNAEYDALDDFITDHGVEMAQGIRALVFPATSNDDVLGLRTLVSQLKTATSASQKNSRIQNHFNALGNAERDDVASLFVILLGAVAPTVADDLISNNTIKSTFNSLIHDGAPVAFGSNEYVQNVEVAIAFGFFPPWTRTWATSCTVLWRYNH